MASWTEGRGYTLILTHPRGPDRYARVALVRKRTLFGPAFNVREARAEDAARSGLEPAALGLGRMLSWRWLGEREAEELLAARLRTLETLGYAILGKDAAARGPWDWLRDLVERQLGRASSVEAPVEHEADDPHTAAASLRESLERLGLEPDAVIEGLSTILDIDAEALREPDEHVLDRLEPELLAMLLPVWLEHGAVELRDVGQRWLALPATLYEIDATVLERWLAGEGPLASALAPRFEREALAMIGPEAIARLAHTAASAGIKSSAADWHARLHAPAR